RSEHFSVRGWMGSSSGIFWWRNKVAIAEGAVGRLFQRHYQSLRKLGELPLIGRFLAWAASRAVPRDSQMWMQVKSGPAEELWLRLNPRTAPGTISGVGERLELEIVRDHLRPDMTFYDVGANIGIFSMMAARAVGPGGQVVAFEADPEIADRLREHARRNSFEWVNVEQKAAWRESGTVMFERVDARVSPDRGVGHIVGSKNEHVVTLDAIALDDCSPKYRPPDFIKCDVEGAECEVLQGARRLLEKKRPLVICEIHNESSRQFVLDEFSRLDYVCENCDENHILALPK
ncbi:MAG TPA: FkbM family methyltransferase, partial [Candidatus Acidoferrales bacterium]|nr:FkbM family methyltransferase [Candidatus Acidoferrales bacterium]